MNRLRISKASILQRGASGSRDGVVHALQIHLHYSRGQAWARAAIIKVPEHYGAERMQVTLEIPDELVSALAAHGQEPSRAALEALGLEAYRRRQIFAYQLRTLLGLPTRWDLDAFLKEHRVETYTAKSGRRIGKRSRNFRKEKP